MLAATCGTEKTTGNGDKPTYNPTNLSNSVFVGNSAPEAGGAIEIAVGRAHVTNTEFEGILHVREELI